MSAPETPLLEQVGLMFGEARRHVVTLAVGFAVIALGALVVGTLLPKQYESSAVILAEAKNIITPLMEGRAVATGVADQATIIGQAMKSRRILREVMAAGGWPQLSDPRAEERFLVRLADRIRISHIGTELIRLSYRDTDPQRSLALTNKLADIYIREGLTSKARQSAAAFEFIDRQVTEYAAKVSEAQEAVQAYYRAHGLSARRPAPARPELTEARRNSARNLAALRAEEAALVAEMEATNGAQLRQRRQERIQQLQRELDSLLGTFTDQHPSVLRVRQELRLAQEDSEKAAAAEDVAARAARARLQDLRRQVAAESVPSLAPFPSLAQTASPEMTVVAQDSTLTELTRRYESSRAVYEDLLKRRENARVSMELDQEQRGLTLRIHEKPELPVVPVGLRLLHFLLIGLALGLALPAGLLVAYLQLDPRIRSVRQLERSALAPLIVTIPCAPTTGDQAAGRRRIVVAAAIVAGVMVSYATVAVLRALHA